MGPLAVEYYSNCSDNCHSHQTVVIVHVFGSKPAVTQAVAHFHSSLIVRTSSLERKGGNRAQPYLRPTDIGGIMVLMMIAVGARKVEQVV